MGRSELERLSREELIDLVLRLQLPEKTSRQQPPNRLGQNTVRLPQLPTAQDLHMEIAIDAGQVHARVEALQAEHDGVRYAKWALM